MGCFMKKILINDVSLRVAANASGSLSFKEKLDIVKRLSDLGIDVIELPLPKEKADEVLVKTICACVSKSIISCQVGLNDVENAYSLIKGAKNGRLLVSIPVSPLQMEYFVSKKPADVLELLKNLTKKASSLCSDVEVSLEDATRAEPEFLYKAIRAAIENGAKTVTVSDSVGNLVPEDFVAFINDIYNAVPELKNIALNVSVSDSFSMAIASSVSSLGCGINGIKASSVYTNDYPMMDKLVAALDYVVAKKGFGFNVNKTAIKRVLSHISEYSSDKNTDNDVSDDKEEIVKTVSQAEINKIIKKRGYDISSEDMKKVYAEFKRLSEKKVVSLKELDVIIATCALQVPETYSLVNFSVNTSNVLSATANITLTKNGETFKGLSFGNGPVDAAFLAIENVTGRHFELDDFELNAVTEGKEALGQALVKLRNNGKLYSGRGVSTDIIGASIRAYVSALNKIAYEERV